MDSKITIIPSPVRHKLAKTILLYSSALLLAVTHGGCASRIGPDRPEPMADAEALQAFEFRNALYSSNPYSYKSATISKEIVKALLSHWKQKKPVSYVVFYLKVRDGWAILEGLPLAVFQARNFREAQCRAAEMGFPGAVDRFRAVLRENGNRWQIVEVVPCGKTPAAGETKRLIDMGVPASLAANHTSMRAELQNHYD